MEIPILKVDAFAEKLFQGNPAAVCLFLEWPEDGLLQSIAAENNLSETAFVLPVAGRYRLRWFTPTVEVDLCGHATLAAAHVILTKLRAAEREVVFETRSGLLNVTRDEDGLLTMDFPLVHSTNAQADQAVLEALGGPEPLEFHEVKNVHDARYLMAVYDHPEAVLALRPDFRALAANVIATAPALESYGHTDFVSRFFAPSSGIDEDPVTGSAHSTLAPYWAAKLGKTELVARQLSARGGTVGCKLANGRVLLSGRCVDYLEGTIRV